MSSDPRPEISLKPTEGRHCGHFFYRFDRARLRSLGPSELSDGCDQFIAALTFEHSPAAQQQSLVISGHKADFGVVVMDEDPLVVDGVHQQLMAGPLGPALVTTWSYISITEVSEYLPSVERFGQQLIEQGLEETSEEYQTKRRQYEKRLQIMRRQRLRPDLPSWPAVCFYPMNKRRNVGANWYLLDFADREQLMREHGESGMKFAGKVTQLVTVGLGLDDWEWGVTLWARNPELLAEIVYKMRFDEASAKYGEFGPFYVGYLAGGEEILKHCRIAEHG